MGFLHVSSNWSFLLIGLCVIHLQCSIPLNVTYVILKRGWRFIIHSFSCVSSLCMCYLYCIICRALCSTLSTFTFDLINVWPHYTVCTRVSCSLQRACCWKLLNIWVSRYATSLFYISSPQQDDIISLKPAVHSSWTRLTSLTVVQLIPWPLINVITTCLNEWTVY